VIISKNIPELSNPTNTTVQSTPPLEPITLADGSVLTPLRLVRVVPGKRLVYQAVWNEQPVFAKMFIGKDAVKYVQRDWTGIQALLKAHIATPAILAYQPTADGKCRVLILDEIVGAQNLQQIWQSEPPFSTQRQQLASRLVKEVAKHHEAGLQQTDLYLKNFLHKDDQLYTLDGDGIKALPKSHAGQAALRNLATLLSKFDVLEVEKWLPQLLKDYGKARAWQTLPRTSLLQHLIAVHRYQATQAYADKKVFRTCTDVAVKRLPGEYRAVASTFSQHTEIQSIDSLDQSLQVPAFKSGNTCTVGLLTTKDAQKVVVKRYNVKSAWHGIMRSFRKTRAAASWANAHRLLLLDLPAIRPVSLLEQRYFFNLLRGKSYFLSEYVEAPTIADVFTQEKDKVKRAALVKQLVELFYRLYLLQISHGDMKASNILVVDGQPLLIDLDSMQQHRFGPIAKHQHARDIRRFMRNWQHDEALTNAFKKVFKVVYADHQPLTLAHIN
jgi:tRNA A-37 threonylcarbamoyl transferase component Bud32